MMRTTALVLALACVHSALGASSTKKPTTTTTAMASPQPPASNPCATAAPGTCSSFACPANHVLKADVVLCGNAKGPDCSSHLCCNVVTTVTTTPAPTCGDFTCPKGWKTKGETVVCGAGSCDKATCCKDLPPPCTTVTTTPAPTCASFTCPSGYSANKGSTVCGMGKCNKATCCAAIVTTVTTTPAPTCGDFTCPKGWKTKGEKVVCAAGSCDKATCCKDLPPPCTTVTTTPAPTCASFTCPSGYSANKGSTVCGMGKCNKATCCAVIVTTVTTTPCTTTTPATPVTCDSSGFFGTSFTCANGYTANAGSTVCAKGKCNTATCCTIIVTTVTTTPAPKTTPSDPCAPSVVGRKYDAKESALAQEASKPKKETSMMPAWAFPLFGVVTMFSLASFLTVRVRRGQRSTRQLNIMQPVSQDEELGDASLLSDDGSIVE